MLKDGQQLKKWTLILGIGLLIFSYQNCSSPNQQSQIQGTSDHLVFDKIKTMPIDGISFWDHERGLRLDVSLNSGVMTAYEDMGAVRAQSYCLNPTELGRLSEILSDSNICEPAPSTVENCAQPYMDPPYASMTIDSHEFNLGERYTPCETPTDLCDGRGEELRDYITGVLRNLEARNCQP